MDDYSNEGNKRRQKIKASTTKEKRIRVCLKILTWNKFIFKIEMYLFDLFRPNIKLNINSTTNSIMIILSEKNK